MDLLPTIEMESPSGGEVNASIIWLHGLGADGSDFAPIVPQLNLPEGVVLRYIFPNAPSIPVSINNGFVMPAWYDIKEMDIDRHVDEAQLRESADCVHAFIDREIERGVDSSRIIVAGFSQGGAVSFEAGLSYPKRLAGIMALSTYFATAAIVEVNPIQNGIPLFICHGSMDPVVPEVLGQKSVATLKSLGFEPEYKTYPMEHSLCPPQIGDIAGWIGRVLG
ncbi:MAG: carboxylesterase [Pseudohongiella sp.]|nr:MAG: carboxylesterase [Pseudohongiella sp.]